MNENSTERANRIAKIRKFLCNDDNQLFAQKLQSTTTFTSSLCNGKTTVGEKLLQKILTIFPEVSRAWLYFGEGEMLVENSGSIGIVAGGGNISNSGTIAGTMNSSSPDLDALIHTLSQLSETIHTQSDTLNQQSTQISRLIDLLASKE